MPKTFSILFFFFLIDIQYPYFHCSLKNLEADLIYLYYVRVMQKLHCADLPLDLMKKNYNVLVEVTSFNLF